jgi:DNA-binding NarL/FixJ family response regulator
MERVAGSADGSDAAAHVAPARVLIAGAHPVLRAAVRRSCESIAGLEVVGEVEDLDELLEACHAEHPDVLVLDDELTGVDGSEALRQAREHGVAAGVLMITDRTDGPSVLGALKLGVRGYLDKADGFRGVGAAVRLVAAGERVIDPELEQAAVMALGSFARNAREGSEVQATLTPREHEILVMVSTGSTMQQVARRLGISPRTVETHVAKLYRKLGVRTRVQAVARAAQLGLIDL